MRHPAEGVLRRLLDEPAGVIDAHRRHVAGCEECRDGLAAVRHDAVRVDAVLATGAAAASATSCTSGSPLTTTSP